jgi:thiol-disulfide isomerase/thioredoxin
LKKIITLLFVGLLIVFVMTGCSGGIPSNGTEGEGEGEGAVKQVVLVEAFIADQCPICAQIKPHLERLASEYSRDEMILVELIPWRIYTIPESAARYNWYNITSGVPYTMFNGPANHLAGSHAYSTLKNRINAQLNISPKVSIEAHRTKDGQKSVISGTIKNIGTTTLSNMVVNGMTFKGNDKFAYAVTYIFEKEKVSIPSLASGESKSFTITLPEDIGWDEKKLNGVIFVQETTGNKIVRQSLYIK